MFRLQTYFFPSSSTSPLSLSTSFKSFLVSKASSSLWATRTRINTQWNRPFVSSSSTLLSSRKTTYTVAKKAIRTPTVPVRAPAPILAAEATEATKAATSTTTTTTTTESRAKKTKMANSISLDAIRRFEFRFGHRLRVLPKTSAAENDHMSHYFPARWSDVRIIYDDETYLKAGNELCNPSIIRKIIIQLVSSNGKDDNMGPVKMATTKSSKNNEQHAKEDQCESLNIPFYLCAANYSSALALLKRIKDATKGEVLKMYGSSRPTLPSSTMEGAFHAFQHERYANWVTYRLSQRVLVALDPRTYQLAFFNATNNIDSSRSALAPATKGGKAKNIRRHIQIQQHSSQPGGVPNFSKAVEHAWGPSTQQTSSSLTKDRNRRRPETILIPLKILQGMVGAYEWFRKGIAIPSPAFHPQLLTTAAAATFGPTSERLIYPHFGVFPPTRMDYIHLFSKVSDARLKSLIQAKLGSQNRNDDVSNADENILDNRVRILDIGCGTGVLSLMAWERLKAVLLEHSGLQNPSKKSSLLSPSVQVIGIDKNPRALACARENAIVWGAESNTTLVEGDILSSNTWKKIDGKLKTLTDATSQPTSKQKSMRQNYPKLDSTNPPLPSLFMDSPKVKNNRFDLIICNPPWIPAPLPFVPGKHQQKSGIDGVCDIETEINTLESAVCDPQHTLVKGILNIAHSYLSETGELWLVMSDLPYWLGMWNGDIEYITNSLIKNANENQSCWSVAHVESTPTKVTLNPTEIKKKPRMKSKDSNSFDSDFEKVVRDARQREKVHIYCLRRRQL